MATRPAPSGTAQAIRGGMPTRWRCGTCQESQPPDAIRMREPGWEPGDFDCARCWTKSHPITQENRP